MPPLSTLKAGDYIKDKYGNYHRVLSDVQHAELGELATVLVSGFSKDKTGVKTKEAAGFLTLFELTIDNFSLDTTPTREEILSKLTQEERDIIEGK